MPSEPKGMLPTDPAQVIAEHEAAGRQIDIGGVSTFVREEGDGEPVLLMHGVPVSSLLYRKVLPELAKRGLRGIAYDLPGLGLSARPEHYDYSWTGLGEHGIELVTTLGLERFHLVVHDIGGPVGFEIAAAMPERIASLTLLNTLVEVASFRKPWVMRPFEKPGLGELYLKAMVPSTFVPLMYAQGVSDNGITPAEIEAHLQLLKHGDGGRAFLQIMRSFETTAEKQARYVRVVRNPPYPVQALWGSRDPALTAARYGNIARRLVGDDRYHEVPGKHFLQESHAPEIALRIAELVDEGPEAERGEAAYLR